MHMAPIPATTILAKREVKRFRSLASPIPTFVADNDIFSAFSSQEIRVRKNLRQHNHSRRRRLRRSRHNNRILPQTMLPNKVPVSPRFSRLLLLLAFQYPLGSTGLHTPHITSRLHAFVFSVTFSQSFCTTAFHYWSAWASFFAVWFGECDTVVCIRKKSAILHDI